MVYQSDLLQPSNINGGESLDLFINYNFGNAAPYKVNDTIVHGFSALGGFYKTKGEGIANDTAKNYNPEQTKPLAFRSA